LSRPLSSDHSTLSHLAQVVQRRKANERAKLQMRRSRTMRTRERDHRLSDRPRTASHEVSSSTRDRDRDSNPFRLRRRSSLSGLHLTDLRDQRSLTQRRRRHSSASALQSHREAIQRRTRQHSRAPADTPTFRSSVAHLQSVLNPRSVNPRSSSQRRGRSSSHGVGQEEEIERDNPFSYRRQVPPMHPPPLHRGPSRPSSRVRRSFGNGVGTVTDAASARARAELMTDRRRVVRSPMLRQTGVDAHVRRRRRSVLVVDREDAESTAASVASSMAVHHNVSRDEEIARLLQQRDSLLQHFHDTMRQSGGGAGGGSMAGHVSASSFDINALRQRPRRHGGHGHGHGHHGHHRHASVGGGQCRRVDLTYLPIRVIQESDIGKGTETQQSCSICQEKFEVGDKVKTLPCFHFFHAEEIDRWLTHSNKRACPVCRHSIDQVNFK